MSFDAEVNGQPHEGEEPGDGDAAARPSFEGLDEKQSNAVMALLNEPTVTRAANICGIHERTLRRWMADPTFKRAYHNARREAFGHAIGITQRYAPVAVTVLAKVMTDGDTPPGIKVAAAGTMLRFGREGIELDDLAQRVEELEMKSEEAEKWRKR
jgi:hypothetical protein